MTVPLSSATPAGWAARVLVVGALLYFLANVLVTAGTAQSIPDRPDVPHSAWDRDPDLAASSTLMLQTLLEAAPLADDEIDFNLLRQTRLPRRPPPLYPEGLEPRDGQRVRILGFMSPYNSLEDMRLFMLMPSATGCYFCIPPSPREVIFVRLKDQSRPQEFLYEPLEVTGTLKLWREGSTDAAHRMFLFVMDDAEIRPLDAQREAERRRRERAAR